MENKSQLFVCPCAAMTKCKQGYIFLKTFCMIFLLFILSHIYMIFATCSFVHDLTGARAVPMAKYCHMRRQHIQFCSSHDKCLLQTSVVVRYFVYIFRRILSNRANLEYEIYEHCARSNLPRFWWHQLLINI